MLANWKSHADKLEKSCKGNAKMGIGMASVRASHVRKHSEAEPQPEAETPGIHAFVVVGEAVVVLE